MARVTGIGGVFLRSADPKALGAWYAKHLGIEVGDYGANFLWKDEVPKGYPDANRWVFEAREGTAYHVVGRLSPRPGPLRDLGNFFFALARVPVPLD